MAGGRMPQGAAALLLTCRVREGATWRGTAAHRATANGGRWGAARRWGGQATRQGLCWAGGAAGRTARVGGEKPTGRARQQTGGRRAPVQGKACRPAWAGRWTCARSAPGRPSVSAANQRRGRQRGRLGDVLFPVGARGCGAAAHSAGRGKMRGACARACAWWPGWLSQGRTGGRRPMCAACALAGPRLGAQAVGSYCRSSTEEAQRHRAARKIR
mmetsp:Transcript_22997/g.57632  ORF Transcript_22997/g.57632 Transcript_22997/m.57632 type:complete len:215 (+) Transcript_22997:232-876(+)